MVKKKLMIAMLACVLCGAASLGAQQAESVVPGRTLPAEVKVFQKLEDEWSKATVDRDRYTMALLLSPFYLGISSKGEVSTRDEQIANLFDKEASPVSMLQRVVSVRMFGDATVVSGTYDMKWDNKGRLREEKGVFTHVYTRAQNRWECVNAQRTAVVVLNPGAEKAQENGRKSGHAER